MARPADVSARLLPLIACVLGVAGCGDDGQSSPRTAAHAVVTVTAQRCDRPNRISGHAVRVADGTFVTAAHTIGGPLRELRVGDLPATVTAVDERTDLARLEVLDDHGPAVVVAASAPGGESVPLSLITIDDGEPRIAELTGERPARLTVNDTTAGRRYERDAIAFDTAVVDGTSGAPLVTSGGEVAGIVVLAVDSARERSYAAAASEIEAIVQRPVDRTLEPVAPCA
jgi:S1-C subfamily serine protease